MVAHIYLTSFSIWCNYCTFFNFTQDLPMVINTDNHTLLWTIVTLTSMTLSPVVSASHSKKSFSVSFVALLSVHIP